MGFEGYYCDQEVDDCVDANGNPRCLNDATCQDVHNNYTCTCVDGFTGMKTCFVYTNLYNIINISIRIFGFSQ